MTEIVNNNRGKSFPPPTVFVGYVFLVIGLLSMLGNLLIGLGLMLAGGFLSFTSTGVQIDTENKKFKEYTSFFGIKKGQWKSLDNYPFLTVLRSRESYTAYSRSNVTMTFSENYCDICLLDKAHRRKLVIKRLTDKEQATKDAKVLADKLGVQFTAYNPVVSAETRASR